METPYDNLAKLRAAFRIALHEDLIPLDWHSRSKSEIVFGYYPVSSLRGPSLNIWHKAFAPDSDNPRMALLPMHDRDAVLCESDSALYHEEECIRMGHIFKCYENGDYHLIEDGTGVVNYCNGDLVDEMVHVNVEISRVRTISRFGNTQYVYMTDSDIERGDDVRYFEDIGEYGLCRDAHSYDFWFQPDDEDDDDDDDDDEDSLLWSYGGGPKEDNFVLLDTQDLKSPHGTFGFGMEIEKNNMPDGGFSLSKTELYSKTGAVLERDGSVEDGFELKTPVYNLFSSRTDRRLQDLREFADVDPGLGAGGHIGLSWKYHTANELFDAIKGWVPLIYAMYKKRLSNNYCSGVSVDTIASKSGRCYEAIAIREGDYIEFRLIASVKSFSSVMFRLQFFRIMCRNLNASFYDVMAMATNKNTALYKLLRSDVYSDPAKMARLLKDAEAMNTSFLQQQLSDKQIRRFNHKIKKLTPVCA